MCFLTEICTILGHTRIVNQAFWKLPDINKFPGWGSLALSHEKKKNIEEILIVLPLHINRLWVSHMHYWIQLYFTERRLIFMPVLPVEHGGMGKLGDLPTVTQEIINRNRCWMWFLGGVIRCFTGVNSFLSHISFKHTFNLEISYKISVKCRSLYSILNLFLLPKSCYNSP